MPTCVDWPREWICEKNKITFTRFRHNSSHMQWQSDWHDKLIRFRNRFNAIIFSTVNAILGPLDAGVSNLFSLRATSELDCGRRGGVGGVYLYLLITMHCRYQILVSSEIISSKSTLANCNSFFTFHGQFHCPSLPSRVKTHVKNITRFAYFHLRIITFLYPASNHKTSVLVNLDYC